MPELAVEDRAFHDKMVVWASDRGYGGIQFDRMKAMGESGQDKGGWIIYPAARKNTALLIGEQYYS